MLLFIFFISLVLSEMPLFDVLYISLCCPIFIFFFVRVSFTSSVCCALLFNFFSSVCMPKISTLLLAASFVYSLVWYLFALSVCVSFPLCCVLWFHSFIRRMRSVCNTHKCVLFSPTCSTILFVERIIISLCLAVRTLTIWRLLFGLNVKNGCRRRTATLSPIFLFAHWFSVMNSFGKWTTWNDEWHERAHTDSARHV